MVEKPLVGIAYWGDSAALHAPGRVSLAIGEIVP